MTILVMTILLVSAASWIGYIFYQAKQNNFAFQNQQLGRSAGQQDVIRSIQTTGYFAFNAPDSDGKEQQIVLVGQLTTPQQLQQLQQQNDQQRRAVQQG